MAYTIDINIRLVVEGDEPTEAQEGALGALAEIMLVQAEDGLYTYGSPDTEPGDPPGDADPYPENEHLATFHSMTVESISRVIA